MTDPDAFQRYLDASETQGEGPNPLICQQCKDTGTPPGLATAIHAKLNDLEARIKARMAEGDDA